MSQHEIELILTRQFAACLSQAAFLVDPDGNLLFYNEGAEELLGQRFDETGEMPAEKWSTVFRPTDEDGKLIPPENLPLVKATRTRMPAHSRFCINGLDGERRKLAVTAIPLVGQAGRFVGALALFWEAE